ncbi:toxin-antitoxin system YwqK family antitoxin [Gaetbulibacter jejuensis]|uniref:MORN repeat protein n=1 Tax=Gaetbulibacter jejuensis TaxID=584607 RepID=A0ABN1JYZ9_9FLAO
MLIFYCFLSCENEHKVEYYNDGKIKKEYYLRDGKLNDIYKEYYPNGKLKQIHYYRDNVKVDSSITYYKSPDERIKGIIYWKTNGVDSLAKRVIFNINGDKLNEGSILHLGMDKFVPVGNWRYFDAQGRLKSTREYKNIDGKSYLNQVWSFNTEGDTLYYPTTYFEIIKAQDTFALNYPFRAAAILGLPIFKERKSEIYVVLPKSGFNFNSDFSNEKEIELDTFYNLTKDIVNQRWFPKDEFRFTVAFGKKIKKTGDYTVRGYIVEYFEQDSDSMGVIREENIKYFEIPIYVKDTIIK